MHECAVHDQPSISVDTTPRLTSHLRALSLIAPLQRAEDNKGMLHVSSKALGRFSASRC
jgi:hypothetical protein